MGSIHAGARLRYAAFAGLLSTVAIATCPTRGDEATAPAAVRPSAAVDASAAGSTPQAPATQPAITANPQTPASNNPARPTVDTSPAAPTSTQPTASTLPAIPDESGVTKLDTVTVTANRVPTTVADVGSSATVITAEEIQQKQQPLVSDVLRAAPGLDVVRSGGPNQVTSVFMRGANSDHTLVMIDGIEANDPSSPSRAFDFSTLSIDNIEQIEVIRGPQSTLWGSNAIGGVINIVSKRGEGPLTGYVSGEAGSFNTYRESAGFSGGTKFVNYSLSVTENDSQGFPAADAKYGNKTPDGYDNTSFATRVGLNFSDQLSVDLIARFQDNRSRLDDGGGPGQDDPNRWLKSTNEYLRVAPHVILFDGALVQTYGFNYTHYVRDDTSHQFPSQNVGSTLKFDFQNDLHLTKNNTFTAGLDLSEEGYRGTGVAQKYANTYGIFAQDQMNFADSLFLTAGARFEDDSLSGPNFTYRATAAYLFPTATKLHASFGTGFKSPTLSDLYSAFGSRDLKAEKSQGWDAGVEQAFFHRRVVLDATYFANHFRDLIDFDFIADRESNVGVARAQGVELGAAVRPTDALSLGLNYTYTSTQDEMTRLSLLRRAPTKIGAFVNYRYCPAGDVTLTVNYVSSRADIDPVTFGQIRVGGYTVVNLATSYKITDSLQVTARIDNLLNQHYEEVAGFGTADISFYGGLKWTF